MQFMEEYAMSMGASIQLRQVLYLETRLARRIQRELRNYTSDQILKVMKMVLIRCLLGVQTQRDGTLALNSNTLKNTFEKSLK